MAEPHGRGRVMSETLAAKCAELGAQGLLVVLLPRILGPSGYGRFAVAAGTVSLGALTLGLGAPLAAVRYVPASLPGERLGTARALASRVAVTRAWMLGALTAAAVLVAVLSPGIPLLAVIAVCVATWFSVASSVIAEVALAVGRRRVWNVRFPLENALILGGALAGYAAFGLSGAIVAIAFGAVATFALISPRVLADLKRAPRDGQLPPGVVTYARLQTISSLIFMTVLRGSPLAVALLGATSRQVGFSAIAAGVTAAGGGIVGSLLDVQLPRLAAAARIDLAGAESEARRAALRTLSLVVLVSFPAALLVSPIIEVGLGAGFAGAATAVAIGMSAVPLAATSALAGLTASLRLRPGLFAAAWSCGGLVFVVVLALGVPALAAQGAALAVLAAILSAALAATVLLGPRAMTSTFLASLVGVGAILAAAGLGGAL